MKADVSVRPRVRVSAPEEGSGWRFQGRGGECCAAIVNSTVQRLQKPPWPTWPTWACAPPSAVSTGWELRSGGQGRRGTMWERGTRGPVVDDTPARQLPQLVRDKGQSAISSSLWSFPHTCGRLTRRWATWGCAGLPQPRLWALFPQPALLLSPCWRTRAFPAECGQAPRLSLLSPP